MLNRSSSMSWGYISHNKLSRKCKMFKHEDQSRTWMSQSAWNWRTIVYSSQLEHAQSQLPTWIQGFLNHLTRIMKFDLPWSMCVLSAEVVLHIPTVLNQNNFVDMKMDYDHSMAFKFWHLTGCGAMRVHCNWDMVKFSSYSYYRVFNLFKAHSTLAPKSTLCMQPDLQQYIQLSSVILSQLYRT